MLTPSVWEQRLTTRFCENANLEEAYVAVESREALEDWNSNAWPWVFGSLPYSLEFISTRGSPNRGRFTEPPERKRASLPDTEHMVSSAPAFGITRSEKRTLDLITDHPMIPREHLARWLGVSEGRVSQMLHNLDALDTLLFPNPRPMNSAIFRCYCVAPMKVLDFVQLGGPKCTVGGTVFEMWLGAL